MPRGDRLRCVVFGKFGLRQGPALHAGLAAADRVAQDAARVAQDAARVAQDAARVAQDAARVAQPTLFHLHWQDETFPGNGQLEPFDLLAAPEKELIGYSGTHAETKPAAIARWRDFVCRHLALSA
ncbi:MAG: hypothetical protein ACRDOK_08755 [Streptosporangiaceae bacterium]